ncbi:PadR family transcriptional regulator [Bacillus wiedmannii]|uniref:PadR family transcriptional regulator n=1 Tax=Bacillus wiedmannii TaxID=1890302 RepID=A0A4U3B5P9_9BACI|nr:PadR family transcriptional regulator [Bacillus wiedmannii]TKI96715.1 PadR family transcriptional regulator [Bacillus wiedmannii]
MSNRRYIKIIADIIRVTFDIFEKSLIYLEGYSLGYARAEV